MRSAVCRLSFDRPPHLSFGEPDADIPLLDQAFIENVLKLAGDVRGRGGHIFRAERVAPAGDVGRGFGAGNVSDYRHRVGIRRKLLRHRDVEQLRRTQRIQLLERLRLDRDRSISGRVGAAPPRREMSMQPHQFP